MRLVDRLGDETGAFHDVTDEEVFRLLGAVTAEDYRRYLAAMYGFVVPLEEALARTPGIERYVDVRRFQKRELLRRDLTAFHMSALQIDRLPQCAIPWFKTPDESLGWAYPIERSTLHHGDLLRHLAAILPAEVAFASSYLRCYFGAIVETWLSFGYVLDAFACVPHQARQVVESARAAFQSLRAWRFLHDETRSVARLANRARRRRAPAAARRAHTRSSE
jgi:heme oxygenase